MSFLFAFGHFLRLARAGLVMAREGVFVDVDPLLLPPLARMLLVFINLFARRRGRGGLAAAIDRLGPSYVKLGQFLSTRADIFGPKVVSELELLQDRMTPFPRAVAIQTIEHSFGAKLETLYVEFV